jgi:hypothetical protein
MKPTEYIRDCPSRSSQEKAPITRPDAVRKGQERKRWSDEISRTRLAVARTRSVNYRRRR